MVYSQAYIERCNEVSLLLFSIDLRLLLRCIVCAKCMDAGQSVFSLSNERRRLMLRDPPLRTPQSTTHDVGYRPAVQSYAASFQAINSTMWDCPHKRPAVVRSGPFLPRELLAVLHRRPIGGHGLRRGQAVFISNLMSLKACCARLKRCLGYAGRCRHVGVHLTSSPMETASPTR